MIFFGGFVNAGDVTLGQARGVGLFIATETTLTCEFLNCSAYAGRTFTWASLSARAAAGAIDLGAVTTELPAMLMPPSELRSNNATAVFTVNPSTYSSPATSQSDSGAPGFDSSIMFILANGRVTQRFENGWADVTTGDYVGGTGNAYSPSGMTGMGTSFATDLQFANPIVAPAFNLASTTIVVNNQIPDPQPAAGAGASVTQSQSGPAAIVSLPASISSDNTMSDTDVQDPTAAVDGSGSLPETSAMTSVTSNMNTPEPATDLLIGGGLIAAGVFARVKRDHKKR